MPSIIIDNLSFLYRPTPAPSIPLALGARSVGHYRLTPGYRMAPVVKFCVQIFWGVRGTGALMIGGREHLLKPNQVALYFPGYKHLWHGKDETWEFRWWTMDGPLAESITSEFGLEPGVFDSTPLPVDLFRRLEKAILDPTPKGERKASILAYQLLVCAAAGAQTAVAGTHGARAVAAARRQWNNPNFSIKALAHELGQHRSQLSREFRRVMGVSIMEYVMRLRLQKALSLLKGTNKPVKEIAPNCGFRNPNYFARLVRRKFHASPSQIRRGG